MNKKHNKNGFISFFTVITVSAIILLFISIQSLEYSQFFDMVMKKQYRLMNYYNAYSCIDRAILALNQDFFFYTEKEIIFNDLNCSIDRVYAKDNLRIIETHGNYKKINVFRSATVKLFDDHIEILEIR